MSGSSSPPSASDPSMEDILASIRKILNEEEPTRAPSAEPPAAPPADDDVLVLDSSMMVNETPAQAPEPVAAEPAPEPPPPPPPAREPPQAPPVSVAALVAPEAAAAAASSVGSLVRTLAAERSTLVRTGGPTIEDLVRETIRPLLKDWLDQHLPPLVERLVRAEIERVVGRANP